MGVYFCYPVKKRGVGAVVGGFYRSRIATVESVTEVQFCSGTFLCLI